MTMILNPIVEAAEYLGYGGWLLVVVGYVLVMMVGEEMLG